MVEFVRKGVKGAQSWGLVLADEYSCGLAEVVLKPSPALNDSVLKCKAAVNLNDVPADVC